MAYRAKLFYWTAAPNWGDRLSPLLLKHFAGVDSDWERPGLSNVVSLGSVLEHLPSYYQGYVLGSGRLYPETRLNLYTGTAKILALRGPISAKGVAGDYALGDPGLLADELIERPDKEYEICIVPHWTDHDLAQKFWQYAPDSTVVVNPHRDDPLEVITKIAKSRKVVSSSLHGLIVADAFHTPRRFEVPPGADKEGGLLKFKDYHQSISAPLVIGETVQPSKFAVEERRFELKDAFEDYGKAVLGG
jgi:pyruvyltransferase